jgi:hypothetical protein
MAFARVARPVLLSAALLSVALAGCGSGDEVRSYTVPRASDKGGAAGGDFRILGAIYPAEDPQWYFKLTGSAVDLAKHEADFDKFIASVRLRPGTLPDFKLPDGWTRGGPRNVSSGPVTVTFDETVKIGKNELTISQAQGGTVKNVDRWAKQVGLWGVRADNVGQYTREFPADGVNGVRVDLTGKQNPTGGPMMGGKR